MTTFQDMSPVWHLVTACYKVPRRTLFGEPLADQARDLAAVGAALGVAHDRPDDRADRLAVAGADLLGGLGVRLDRGVDPLLQLAAVGDRGQSLALHDLGGISAG